MTAATGGESATAGLGPSDRPTVDGACVYAAPEAGFRVVLLTLTPALGGNLAADGVRLERARGVPCSAARAATDAEGTAVRAGGIYRDAVTGLAVRCVSGSAGQLTLDGRPLRRVR